MWFLECEGDLFEHKRIWLRPGTKLVVGRTSKPEPGQRVRYIENSSVSRKHLTIDVDAVAQRDSSRLHNKTNLTLTDNSKVGSWLNDERLDKGATTLLDKNDNKIKLGHYDHLFHVKWQPIVFSFPSLPRAHRLLDDPLATQRQFLEPLGIKCIVDYIAQFTTHLVAKKRNTPTTLQALVNARYIVTDDYPKQIESVSIDALEQDFDANWPKEEPFSPPPGAEPNPRPDKSPDFLPNPQRSEIFTSYTFIFSDPGQHANLLPVITGGGGKALMHTVDQGNPNAQDFLEYVREVAGKKSDKAFNLSQQPKTKGGIVVVRIGGAKDFMPGFYETVDSSLGQSSVEQNELLEVILDVDASKLKRRVEMLQPAEDADMSNATESPVRQPLPAPSRRRQTREPTAEAQSATPDEVTPATSQPEPTTTKRRGRRPLTQTKFKGFDEIDINTLPKYRSPSPSQPPSHEPSQAPSENVMDDEDRPSPSHPAPTQPSQRSARKRPPPVEEEESHQDVMASMLKGAAAMKKRRIAEGRDEGTTPPDVAMDDNTPAPAVKKPKRRKEKEIDVRAAIEERRKAEEEARLEDEENLRNQLAGMDVGEIRNLVQVEEMEVRRQPPPRSRYNPEAGHDDRWDDRWNGRKNFKRFRRQGVAANSQNRARVFVSLEEVEPKSYGVNDDYFLEPSSRRPKKSQKKSQRSQQVDDDGDIEVTATPASTSRSQPTATQQSHSLVTDSINLISDAENSDDDETNAQRFRRRIQRSRAEDAEHNRAEAVFPEEIAGTARDRDIADAARLAKSSASVRTQPGKRTAKGVVEDVQQPKKRATRRPSPDEVEEEDEDDEESSTRFRRRKK